MKKNCLFSFCSVAGVLLILFLVNAYAPFGSASLADGDARIQYIDFFLYLRDVLSGSNSISYTFSKMLGGSAFSLFSYYLASPLNLLIVFFPKTQILSFFDLLILLKASLAAAAFAAFLSVRFEDRSCRTVQASLYTVLLSAAYGLSQYTLSQSSNIMWLDGVMMLPLILLGVFRVVKGRGLVWLAVPVALSVLFNWYTAGMNCLFSAVWFFLEFALNELDVCGSRRPARFAEAAVRYAGGVALGLLCSAVLFLPTVHAMSGNEKGDLHFSLLLDPAFRGHPITAVESAVFGAQSSERHVSLFCGIPALVAVPMLFLQKRDWRQKLVFAAFLTFLLLMFYWSPLYSLFNLLENPSSYYCRFSYLQIAGVLFLAACALLQPSPASPSLPLVSGLLYSLLLLLVFRLHPYESRVSVWLTALGIVLVASAMTVCQHASSGRRFSRFGILLLISLCALDFLYGANLQLTCFRRYEKAGAETPAYIAAQDHMIRRIRDRDPGAYRIAQTVNRWTDEHRWTANYNESFAYGYWSISEYSSTSRAAQIAFLDQAGYREEADVMNITNMPVLGTDSLLGVRYILSDIPVNGLTAVSEDPRLDGKQVYRNPYALPLCFSFRPGTVSAAPAGGNPFVYQNALFSQLMGEDVMLYVPLTWTKTVYSSPGDALPVQVYQLVLPEGNTAVYGNLPARRASGLPVINLNNRDSTVYACWLSPSVFYIPTVAGEKTAEIRVSGDVDFSEGEEQFYALDLDLLQTVSEKLQANAADELSICNGHISVRTKAKDGDMLFLSVPCDEGWTVRLNGEPASPVLIADLFYCFPLQDGINELEMQYRVPFLSLGTVLSLCGLLLLAAAAFSERRRMQNGYAAGCFAGSVSENR
ncbi:MAG: YfhO family protein [Oscillospiraceae bacterium]|nr:YfhO family protein [Oscillospiraceae bacterium]